jgi:glycosyltransferase involved in cell wall biosynthesis
MDKPLVSIIINNYNYEKYIKEAIDSALNQTYINIEIIVVDDGSKDGSAKIIDSYDKQLKVIYKQNGGQGSCFNVGFEASSGEIIIFLDSDDTLLPHAITKIVDAFSGQNIAKAYAHLLTMDQDSKPTGRMVPNTELEEGSLLQKTLLLGPASHANPPTSGNAWSRSFLNQVLPLPADDYRISADAYLFTLSPLFGNFARIEVPIGYYRIHKRSHTQKSPFELKRLEKDIRMHMNRVDELSLRATNLGHYHNKEEWKHHSRR